MRHLLITKDKQGQQWFLGLYSNNFEDRDNDTITWDAHIEYAKWVKETGVKLPITVAHQPKYPVEVHFALLMGLANGIFTPEEFSDSYMKLYKPFAFAQTEVIVPINGFMLVAGKILKDKEDVVELLHKSDWGMSHGFLSLDRDEDTIKHYRSFEFTTLPIVMAANLLTTSNIKEFFVMDEFKSLSEEDRQTLKDLLDADPEQLEEGLSEMHTILSKVVGTKEVEVEAEEVVEETYEDVRTKIYEDFGMESLNKSFSTIADTLQTVLTRMDEIENRMKPIEVSEDEKIAAAFESPNWEIRQKSEEEEEVDKESLRDNALGEKPLEGIETKEYANDPMRFTWETLVLGNQ